MRADICGTICQNNDKWAYQWMELDATCPRDVLAAMEACPQGERLDLYINSHGGDIHAGSEIYDAVRSYQGEILLHVPSLAASAASVIMCGAKCTISPTALVMIHCVSTRAVGNHLALEATAEVLIKADKAMCQAYIHKTGRSQEEILALMEKEHWMTAKEAVEMGFCDEISDQKHGQMTAAMSGPVFSSSAVACLKNLVDQEQRFLNLGGAK